MNAAAQFTTIGALMLCGLAMGLVFDVYRVASHRFHIARWLLPGLDVVYWAAATLGVFNILLNNNYGEVRMYVFLGLGIGVTGYFGLFSARVVKLTGWLFERFKGLFRILWKLVNIIIIVPVTWIVRLLAKLLDIVFVVTAALLLWVGRLLLKPFSALGRRLWAMLLPVRRQFRPVVGAYVRMREKVKMIRDIFRKKP